MKPYTKDKHFEGRLDKFDLTETKKRMKRVGRKQARTMNKKELESEYKQSDLEYLL